MSRFQALRAGLSSHAAAATLTVLMVALSVAVANAAAVGTLFFDGPLGASAPSGVPVMSFTLGSPSGSTAATGSGGARQPSPSSLQVTKMADATSPKLFQAASMGQHILKMRLVVGARTLTFEDVLVSSYRASAGAGRDAAPTETITFNFMRMSDTSNPPTTIRVLNGPAMLQPQASPTPTPDTVRMPAPR
jgi:type VI secretion system secreted protein Hcp